MLLVLLTIATVSSRSLVYFIELARHGARSPSNNMEWDENRWPDGASILTPEGMRQHFQIGKFLKTRYNINTPSIPSEYNVTSLTLIANEVERTQRSLMSQMLGFYPKKTWNKKLSKNPSVPINLKNTTFVGNDFFIPAFYMQIAAGNTMLRAKDGCPQYKSYVKSRKKSSGADKIFDKYKDIVQQVQQKYECSYKEAKDLILEITSSIRSNSFAENSWDPYFDEKFCEKAQELYMEIKHFSSFSPDYIARFTASDFLRGIYEILDKVRNRQIEDKGTIFLAHDTTIFSVISGLGAWMSEQPPFATVLLFEVYFNEDRFEIEMIYNMKSVRVPGFGKFVVGIDEFLDYLKGRSFEDFDKSCQDIEKIPIEEESIEKLEVSDDSHISLNTCFALSQYFIVFTLFYMFLKKSRNQAS